MRRRKDAIDGPKPTMEGRDRTKAEPRGARRRAALAVEHLDGESAETVHHGKAVLVGGVVAGIDRATAGEGRLGEKGGDRRALVTAAWLKLDHLAPKNDTDERLLRSKASRKA